MQKCWLAALAFLFVAICASAEDNPELRASKPEVRRQIVAVIDAQLAAFRKHDAALAYSYAASALREQKPLPVFATIVRTSYPEIWNNTRAECGIVRDNGERATVLVHVVAKDGDASYDYSLVKEPAGWRVHGVLRHDRIDEDKV